MVRAIPPGRPPLTVADLPDDVGQWCRETGTPTIVGVSCRSAILILSREFPWLRWPALAALVSHQCGYDRATIRAVVLRLIKDGALSERYR